MATASNIDDLLQCPICLDILRDPKVLDCQHTFCADCLKAHLITSQRASRTENTIECKFYFNYKFLLLFNNIFKVQHVVHDRI